MRKWVVRANKLSVADVVCYGPMSAEVAMDSMRANHPDAVVSVFIVEETWTRIYEVFPGESHVSSS